MELPGIINRKNRRFSNRMNSVYNKYIDTYINNYVRHFRNFDTNKYTIKICGLAGFITKDDQSVEILINKLRTHDFEIIITNGLETLDEILVEFYSKENGKHQHFEYSIESLISTLYLSSKSGISVVGILVMQILSKIICKHKTMYKAIILDLDDTVWKGTLSEDGAKIIKRNLSSKEAIPFVSFMRFIYATAKELGLYVAVCSRNDVKEVLSIIEKLNEIEFPIKSQIDCIVANHNDKSKNIKAIAQQLSILTNACVFIDDNQIVRDEVRQNLPDVFVPEWDNHDELTTILIMSCIFNKFELSLKSRNRKRLYKVLQQEREKSYLPQLLIKTSLDINHIEANRLYTKSNQFRFAAKKSSYEKCKSLFFEIFRDNGENLGICSAITFIENEHELHILNWAISCRYFEIGLEEYILIFISILSNERMIKFTFTNTNFNKRVSDLIDKYNSGFVKINNSEDICFCPNAQLMNYIQHNTNLKEYCND